MWDSNYPMDSAWQSPAFTSFRAGGTLNPAETERWNEAYVTVESYYRAMGLRHPLLLSRLIYQALERAERRVAQDPALAPMSAAMEETIDLVADWFSHVIGEEASGNNRLATRGRLAMFLADLPGQYQAYFLSAEPLPKEVTTALREGYLKAGPNFQQRAMSPCTVKLNPIMKLASHWWEDMNRTPLVKAAIVGVSLITAVAGLMVFFWR